MITQAAFLFVVQYYLLLTVPFCVAIVYTVQKIYLRTSRQLRFLDLESRSAVYTSFLETVSQFPLLAVPPRQSRAHMQQTQGLSTIRAFGWQPAMERENCQSLDSSHRPFYLLRCLQVWLNVVLDLLIACLAVGLIWLAVALRGTTTGAEIGIALNVIILANATLLRLVQSWTDLEISLGAVARLKEVEESTPREKEPREERGLEESWPSVGELEMVNVTAAYKFVLS